MSAKTENDAMVDEQEPSNSTAAAVEVTTNHAVPEAGEVFVDESGRRRGKVLWYNREKLFGFIVPEEPYAKILKVVRTDLKAKSDDDDIQALQPNQIVKYSTADELSAFDVRKSDESDIDFSVKIENENQNESPRYILMPNHPISNGYPMAWTNGPPPTDDSSVPQLSVDAETLIKGKIERWINGEGWGFIEPDGEFQKIVVERADILSDGYPGLEVDTRVEFYVDEGPYPNSVAAAKVCLEGGEKVVYVADFMKKHTPVEPLSDEVYKGTITFFGGRRGKGRTFGFIQPDGTESKDDHVFLHISETQWMPPVVGAKVEYQLGKGKSDKPVAVSVKGVDGSPLEHERPTKRPKYQQMMPPPAEYGGSYPGAYHLPMMYGGPQQPFYGGYPPMMNRGPQSAKKRKRKKVKGEETPGSKIFECSLCEKFMTGEQSFDAHMKGKPHQKKVNTSLNK